MPGFLLHAGAVVQCAHGGVVQPTVPSPRVTVMGMPVVTLGAPWTVAGCAFPPPPVANGPCVTAQFLAGSLRVRSMGMPLLLADSPAVCTPTGTPVVTAGVQPRVRAT